VILYYWLVWILPLVNHPLWSRKVGPFTVFEYVGILCFIYALVNNIAKRKVPSLLGSTELRLFFLLYIIAFISALIGRRGIDLSNGALIIYTSSVLLVFITIAVVNTLSRLRLAILTLIGSYAFASMYVLREWQLNSSLGFNARPGWIVGDSNYFATASIYAITLAMYLVQARRPFWEKVYCYTCLPIIIVADMLCASRGGFLGLIFASLWFVWGTKHRVRNLLLVTALVLPLSVLMPGSPLHRLLDQRADLGSTQAHLDAWKAGFAMIETHPLFGVGLGEFKPLMRWYAPPGTDFESLAHNMYIEVAAELGLPALIVFVAIFWYSFRTLSKLRVDTSRPVFIRDAAGALQAGLLGVAVAGSFVSAEYQKTTWMGFALIVSLVPLARSLHPDKKNIRADASTSRRGNKIQTSRKSLGTSHRPQKRRTAKDVATRPVMPMERFPVADSRG
jgi:O-antigen ligase